MYNTVYICLRPNYSILLALSVLVWVCVQLDILAMHACVCVLQTTYNSLSTLTWLHRHEEGKCVGHLRSGNVCCSINSSYGVLAMHCGYTNICKFLFLLLQDIIREKLGSHIENCPVYTDIEREMCFSKQYN